jgi:phosphate transport system permease protein
MAILRRSSLAMSRARLAWAGSLVLIVMIMVAVTLVRIFANRGVLKGAS